MGEVARLCHDEAVRLDPGRLSRLVVELGAAGAEHVVARAMEEMATRLSEIDRSYRVGNMQAVCRNARSVKRHAGEIGMTTLARVAGDVHLCAGRGDMVAFAATWERLQRIADRSLTAIWDLQGVSG